MRTVLVPVVGAETDIESFTNIGALPCLLRTALILVALIKLFWLVLGVLYHDHLSPPKQKF